MRLARVARQGAGTAAHAAVAARPAADATAHAAAPRQATAGPAAVAPIRLEELVAARPPGAAVARRPDVPRRAVSTLAQRRYSTQTGPPEVDDDQSGDGVDDLFNAGRKSDTSKANAKWGPVELDALHRSEQGLNQEANLLKVTARGKVGGVAVQGHVKVGQGKFRAGAVGSDGDVTPVAGSVAPVAVGVSAKGESFEGELEYAPLVVGSDLSVDSKLKASASAKTTAGTHKLSVGGGQLYTFTPYPKKPAPPTAPAAAIGPSAEEAAADEQARAEQDEARKAAVLKMKIQQDAVKATGLRY